jgi:hypothetical protein
VPRRRATETDHFAQVARHAWSALRRLGVVAGLPPNEAPAASDLAAPAVTPPDLAAPVNGAYVTLDYLAERSPEQPRRPCLALLGEFSAGKSSLANMLAGTDILPTSVLASTRRLTRLCYADSLSIATIDDQGRRREVELSEITSLQRDEIHEVEIGLPSSRLQHLEILDTPGFADPYRAAEAALDAAERADLAIWCTRSSQAWRHSERLVWLSLPARLRPRSLLLATHRDTLNQPEDAQRVAMRLRREAGDLFRAVIMLSIPDAVAAVDPQTGVLDGERWQASGAQDLASELMAMLELVNQEQAAGVPDSRPSAPAAIPLPPRPQPMSIATDAPPAAERVAAAPSAAGDDGQLGQLLSQVADCRLAAQIDLAAGRLLAVSAVQPLPPDLKPRLAALAVDLLEREAGRRAPWPTSGAEAAEDAAEIVLMTGTAVYLLVRRAATPEQALLLIGARAMPLGAALAAARRISAAL